MSSIPDAVTNEDCHARLATPYLEGAADHLAAGEHHVTFGLALPTTRGLDARQCAQAGVMAFGSRKLTAQAAWHCFPAAAGTGHLATKIRELPCQTFMRH
jgi:hypothetical protein